MFRKDNFLRGKDSNRRDYFHPPFQSPEYLKQVELSQGQSEDLDIKDGPPTWVAGMYSLKTSLQPQKSQEDTGDRSQGEWLNPHSLIEEKI